MEDSTSNTPTHHWLVRVDVRVDMRACVVCVGCVCVCGVCVHTEDSTPNTPGPQQWKG